MATSTTPGRLGRYHLGDALGGGPNGAVSGARVFGVAGLETQYAIKRLHPALLAQPGVGQRLSQAMRAYASLEHPRIARLQEYAVAAGEVFTAVELAPGLDLARLVGATHGGGHPLPPGAALLLLAQVARAVGYAHGRGVHHLGLCPANVVVAADGEARVTDFGVLAQTLSRRPSDEPRLAQRVAYLAPEQLVDEPTSPATDVFALGVLAHELLGGDRAFPGSAPLDVEQAILSGRVREIPAPRPIARVLERCFARSPLERYPDARALADALEAALGEAPVEGGRRELTAAVAGATARLRAISDGELSGAFVLSVPIPPRTEPAAPPARAVSASRPPPIRTPVVVPSRSTRDRMPAVAPPPEFDLELPAAPPEATPPGGVRALVPAEGSSGTQAPLGAGLAPPPPSASSPAVGSASSPVVGDDPAKGEPGAAAPAGRDADEAGHGGRGVAAVEAASAPPAAPPPVVDLDDPATADEQPTAVYPPGALGALVDGAAPSKLPAPDRPAAARPEAEAPAASAPAPAAPGLSSSPAPPPAIPSPGDAAATPPPPGAPLAVRPRRWVAPALLAATVAAAGLGALALSRGGGGDAASPRDGVAAGTGVAVVTMAPAAVPATAPATAPAVPSSPPPPAVAGPADTPAPPAAIASVDAAGAKEGAGASPPGDPAATPPPVAVPVAAAPAPAAPAVADGALVIESQPPGAAVFLDGAELGVTPVQVAASGDRHRLALVLPGHDLYLAEIDGRGRHAATLAEVAPPDGPAGIKVKCKDAQRYYVFVDGRPTGQLCPTERIGVPLGGHVVEVYDLVSEARRQYRAQVRETRVSVRVRVDGD